MLLIQSILISCCSNMDIYTWQWSQMTQWQWPSRRTGDTILSPCDPSVPSDIPVSAYPRSKKAKRKRTKWVPDRWGYWKREWLWKGCTFGSCWERPIPTAVSMNCLCPISLLLILAWAVCLLLAAELFSGCVSASFVTLRQICYLPPTIHPVFIIIIISSPPRLDR